jgi:hypothetical protein
LRSFEDRALSNCPVVNIAVEGDLDEVVLKKILASVGIQVANAYGRAGKPKLMQNVGRYNLAAQHGSWVILVDLDNDAECAPPFIESRLPGRNPNLQLRVAVRAVEAWLLADRSEIARFLGVPQQRIPVNPEDEERPKATLIAASRSSRNRTIRGDIVPSIDSTAREGRGYTARLIEFTAKFWDPGRAAERAPSLKRSIDSLTKWKAGGV